MRVLIIGASGYLGSEIRKQALAAGHDVVGTSFRSEADGLVRVDIRDRDAVGHLVSEVQPNVVVNAAYAQLDWETTAVGPVHIAWACDQEGARLVHVSSDAVFSGDLDSYDETCAPSPMTAYGAAKAAAEVGVAAAMGDAVVVRTSWILGDGNSGFEAFVRALARGETDGVLFDDDIRCPVHVADLAAAVLEVGRLDCEEFTGLLHVAGSDALSRYELGCLLAERDGLDAGALPKASKASAGAKGTAVRLDSGRARGLLATKVRGAHEFTASGTVLSAGGGSRT